jgi:hypothetical protein
MGDYMRLDRKRWAELVEPLFHITDELTRMTGRAFTPDGHLVGSIGEVLAANAYGLELERPSATGCDATRKGRRIEIKATFGTRVAFRSHEKDHAIDHCVVPKLDRMGTFEEIYNGPAKPIFDKLSIRTLPSNGQRAITLAQLKSLNSQVPCAARLPRIGEW